MIQPLYEAPPLSSFPDTGKCKWSFDKVNHVLLGQFKIDQENQSVTEEDETFLLMMMERRDIAVVSKPSVWDVDFISARSGDKMFHPYCVFEKKLMNQENFDSMRLGTQPKSVPNVGHKHHFKHYSKKDNDIVCYLHTYNSVQD